MYCINCGAGLPDEAKFCSNCGTQISQVVKEEEPILQPKPKKETKKPATKKVVEIKEDDEAWDPRSRQELVEKNLPLVVTYGDAIYRNDAAVNIITLSDTSKNAYLKYYLTDKSGKPFNIRDDNKPAYAFTIDKIVDSKETIKKTRVFLKSKK